MTVEFELDGQRFVGINGGPQFKFDEAVSFVINCDDQDEIDYYWERLAEGGEEGQCGWLKDKFGLSWQVVADRDGRALRRSRPGAGRARDESDARDEARSTSPRSDGPPPTFRRLDHAALP